MRRGAKRRPRFLSRISFRLLAFNILLVFLPVFGILSLETYERQLLDLQERSMVQQGRVLAAALGGLGPVTEEDAERILGNMRQQFSARLRVVDRGYRLLADSSRLGPRLEETPSGGAAPPRFSVGEPADGLADEPDVRRQLLYRLGALLYRGYQSVFAPPEPPTLVEEPYPDPNRLTGREVRAALAGEYGRAVRPTGFGQRSLTLYSALPIWDGDRVVGAVVVSRSTFQILGLLYDLRLSTFKVVLATVLAAIVLSLLVSTTIARPIARLRTEAQAILDDRGRLRRGFEATNRLDEIGDLRRALAELTRRLEGHIEFIESFASDVSHEFKNPLASIRNATELLAEVEEPADRERFIGMVLRDIARLEHLLSGVREITQIDARLGDQSAESVDLVGLAELLLEQRRFRSESPRYRLHREGRPRVLASPARLVQVLDNLLANAASFSPPDGEVLVELEARGEDDEAEVILRVADDGPGIPEEHLEKIFDRFFSYRTESGSKERHPGLGLAIVKAIVEGYGGGIRADNRPDGGAVFEVRLPAA